MGHADRRIVEYLFDRYDVNKGVILDPFAGSGTALFVASGKGIAAEGIELLPIGQRIIEANKLAITGNIAEICSRLRFWINNSPWNSGPLGNPLPELRITSSAYPRETEYAIRQYLSAIEHESGIVRSMLFFALLCILEVISYTRKDGQYLRWDYRSGRKQGKKVFVKGNIQPFDSAIISKLEEIIDDISEAGSSDKLFSQVRSNGLITACAYTIRPCKRGKGCLARLSQQGIKTVIASAAKQSLARFRSNIARLYVGGIKRLPRRFAPRNDGIVN